MRDNVRRNFEWQDALIPAMCRIVGRELAPYQYERAPPDEDMRENTDLIIIQARDIRVACRLRREEFWRRFPHDITMRASLASGVKTEVHKFLAGFGRAFFYGFESGNEIAAWRLISLHRLRAFFAEFDQTNPWTSKDLIRFANARGLKRCGHRHNVDGATSFVYFDVRELAAVVPGAIVASFPPITPQLGPYKSDKPKPPTTGLPLFEWQRPDPDNYDGQQDFARSLDVAYADIRARVANGGPGWTPKASKS